MEIIWHEWGKRKIRQIKWDWEKSIALKIGKEKRNV